MTLEEERVRINFEIEYSKVEIIRRNGGMSRFLELNAEQAEELFCEAEQLDVDGRTMICMDEGVPRKKNDLATAGALACMIYCSNPRIDGWMQAMHLCREANIRKIIGHDGCGGMKVVYAHIHGEAALAALSQEALNAFTRKTVQEMADQLSKLVGWQITTCHHSSAKMYRSGSHIAVAAYFCGVRQGFNPNHRFPAMPLGYLINPWGYKKIEVAISELELAVELATTGYAGLISPQKPFMVYVIGQGLLERIRRPLCRRFGGLVDFDQVN